MNNTIYEIITSLNSNQEVLIVCEEDPANPINIYKGLASEIPMFVFSDCSIFAPSLVRLETKNDLIIIVVVDD